MSSLQSEIPEEVEAVESRDPGTKVPAEYDVSSLELFRADAAPSQVIFQLLNGGLLRHDYKDRRSPQWRLLDALSGKERSEKLAVFEDAKRRSRKICLDRAVDILFGEDWRQSSIEMSDHFLIQEIITAFKTGASASMPDYSDRVNDPQFMNRLTRELRNSLDRDSRDKKREDSFGGYSIQIARIWTHPFWPVWMMTSDAGAQCVRYLYNDPSFTTDNYEKITRREELPRFDRNAPIRALRFVKNAKEGRSNQEASPPPDFGGREVAFQGYEWSKRFEFLG